MFVDDLIPFVSGQAHLGVNAFGPEAFDITSIKPFGHVHMISGIFHDTILGQSGVIRYNRAGAVFELSVDGGLTFDPIQTGTPGGVSSIGVIGDANLTGAVDVASPASGFIVIQDSGDASPLLWSLDQLGLSGLWRFPTQGFNGSIVNALTDFNGTTAQGVINVVGVSGLLVDIVGQTMTISPAQNALARCINQTFTSQTSVTVTHNFGTDSTIVQVRDTNEDVIIPDTITATNNNTVTVTFNNSRSGRIVVFGC